MTITLAPQFTQREYRWTAFKAVAAIKALAIQSESNADTHTVWGYDGPEVHICTIWVSTVPEAVIAAGYTQEQNDLDKADFVTNYQAKTNKSTHKITSDGRVRTTGEKSDATKVTIFSHDWTDPTTWTTQAVRVVDEVATDLGAHTTYDLAHVNVIDTYHGKVTHEDYAVDSSGFSYRVVVKVNDVVKVEQDPHYGTGGDFVVDYAAGTVTFLSALTAEDEVKVTYHYENGSAFVIKPAAGKVLRIGLVECQFSTDVVLNDTVVFQPYGLVDVFAPQLMPGVPSGTKIPLGNPVRYKTMSDYQNDATRAYPAYPALGGDSWRGSPVPVVIFDWDYVSETPLKSAAGMEIRISLEHNTPFGGWYATATFYCTTENEG